MAESSAETVFSSPEAVGTLVGGGLGSQTGLGPVGTLVGGEIGGMAGGGSNPFAEGAEADRARADAAFETAKNLQTTVETTGTQATKGTTTNNQTSQTTFAPKTAQEQALFNESIANFQKQGALVDDFEAGIAGRLGTQGQARDALGNILGGQAFGLTADEQARIEGLRGADIAASSAAVNELLDKRLAATSADAARRGLRGQAFTQLQGDAISTAARELNMATLDANRTAAGNAIAMPGQRVGIQAGTAGQFADFADVAKQAAIQNRQTLQDPVAMQQLFDERMRGGKTETSGTQATDQTTESVDTRIGTGEGAAGVLQAGIAMPSNASATVAGGLGVLGAVAPVVGAAVGGK